MPIASPVSPLEAHRSERDASIASRRSLSATAGFAVVVVTLVALALLGAAVPAADGSGPSAGHSGFEPGGDVPVAAIGGEEDDGDDATADPAAVRDALVVSELHVDGVDPDEERIVLENVGDVALDLEGYAIRDRENGQVDRGLSPFRFPAGFVLSPGDRVTVWTGEGEDTASDLYWGYGVNVWNAEGDVVVVLSPAGERVLEHAYGDADADGGTDGADDTDEAGSPDGTVEVHHIDVGQADSTLVIAPSGETILIDSGDWRRDGEEVIAYLEDLGVERIDHLVATHAHADHIGGHAAVIEHFETDGDGVGAAYDSGVVHATDTYEDYLDAVEAHDVTLYEVEEGDELPVENLSVTVLNPPAGESGEDLHYNSVTLAIEFGEFAYLTTGDAEADAERRMVERRGADLDADVYQAGHHGSSTSSTEPFLEAVDPSVAVISSAYDSPYGHPHDEVLERFDDRGVETYWTGVHGDVVITSDGDDVAVDPEHERSTDPADLLEEKPRDDAQRRVAFDGPPAPTASPWRASTPASSIESSTVG